MKLIQQYIISFHIDITMKQRNEKASDATTHHSAKLLSSAPPPLVLSIAWTNSSPAAASQCESEASKIDMNVLDHHKNHKNQCNSIFGTI
jgi:hypothetical protein